MYKLRASVIKEFLVLLRDIPGLIVLFLLPFVMIIVVSLVQDSTLKKMKDEKIKILYIDNDRDILSKSLREGLIKSDFFEIDTLVKNISDAKKLVAEGKYKIAVHIASGVTDTIRKNVRPIVSSMFNPAENEIKPHINKLNILILTDPALRNSFKQIIISNLQYYSSKIETQILLKILSEQMAELTGSKFDFPEQAIETVVFTEKPAYKKQTKITPNSTQHNVPAWTMFAMFFIVIPLAGNMIHERNNGSFLRLRTMPGSYFTVIGSKTVVYLLITFLQFFIMMLAGIFVLPVFGLPVLHIGTHPLTLILTVLASGLAAVGYGILVGTIAETHEQAGVFGSVSVIILASLGGIWFPVYAMSEMMQKISIISPLNWGLNAFYDIFLKNGTYKDVFPELLTLFLFFALSVSMAYYYEKIKRLRF